MRTVLFLLWPVTLVATLALVAPAQDPRPDPEPPGEKTGETAIPAIDPLKAETDPKLAAQDRANRTTSRNNLKQCGLAFHNYHDAMGRLPDDLKDRGGKSLLSWRVAILPYVDQAALFKEFKLDEPWDSKHNLKLLARMPNVYRSPRVKLKEKGNTIYQGFTGPNAIFGRATPMRFANILDGTSNTILIVESTNAVPWTKPGGIAFDRTKAVPEFGKAFGNKPHVVMMDGSVRQPDLKKIRPDTLKNAIDPADGSPLGKDWND